MRTCILVSLTSVLCVASAGCCAPTYSVTVDPNADYGSPVSQKDAESGAMKFMRAYLKDPHSAQYEWGTVQQAWIHMQPTAFKPRIYGYALEASINGKNGYGGYVGFKPFRFFYRDGKLIQVAEAQANQFSPDGTMWWQVSPPPQ